MTPPSVGTSVSVLRFVGKVSYVSDSPYPEDYHVFPSVLSLCRKHFKIKRVKNHERDRL